MVTQYQAGAAIAPEAGSTMDWILDLLGIQITHRSRVIVLTVLTFAALC